MKYLIVILLLSGCAQHISIESVSREGVAYRSVTKQNLFLWYKTKPIKRLSPYGSVFIGDVTPDPNTAHAVIEAVGVWMGGGK